MKPGTYPVNPQVEFLVVDDQGVTTPLKSKLRWRDVLEMGIIAGMHTEPPKERLTFTSSALTQGFAACDVAAGIADWVSVEAFKEVPPEST